MSHFSMVAFEGLSSAKSDQAKIEGFRAVPTYKAGAEPQPRMRSFICWEADIVLVDTAGESDPFVHDCPAFVPGWQVFNQHGYDWSYKSKRPGQGAP